MYNSVKTDLVLTVSQLILLVCSVREVSYWVKKKKHTRSLHYLATKNTFICLIFFFRYSGFFWSNIGCEVEESAAEEVSVCRAAGRRQQIKKWNRSGTVVGEEQESEQWQNNLQSQKHT